MKPVALYTGAALLLFFGLIGESMSPETVGGLVLLWMGTATVLDRNSQ